MVDEEVGPGEHGVVGGPLLGRDRLPVDHAQEPQPADDRDETYWRNRAQLIRGRIASQNAQIEQLRARDKAFATGAESAEKALVQQTLQKAVADLAFLNDEWLRFEQSARERKVPEHWIR